MAAIHHRFQAVLLERLRPRLGNVQGNTALFGADSSLRSELAEVVGDVPELAGLDTQGPEGQKWDSLICIAEIWRLEDLTKLVDTLTPQGRLFFVEPVAGFGLARRAQSLTSAFSRRWLGLDFECDVPQALRDVGLTPTSTDRFRVGGPVFTFAAGEARRY